MIEGRNWVLLRPLALASGVPYQSVLNRLEADPAAPEVNKIAGRLFVDGDRWPDWAPTLLVKMSTGKKRGPEALTILAERVERLERLIEGRFEQVVIRELKHRVGVLDKPRRSPADRGACDVAA